MTPLVGTPGSWYVSREATAVVAHRIHLAFHIIQRVQDSAHNGVVIVGIVDGASTMGIGMTE